MQCKWSDVVIKLADLGLSEVNATSPKHEPEKY